MAKIFDKDIDSANVPKGTFGGLEHGFPRTNDNDVSIEPLLREAQERERKAVGMRR